MLLFNLCMIFLLVATMSDSEEELSFASVEDGDGEKISGIFTYGILTLNDAVSISG